MEICPKCHGVMKPISERTGFSVGKAAIGAVIAGPVGVAAGALGKKMVQYQCERYGYIIEKKAPKNSDVFFEGTQSPNYGYVNPTFPERGPTEPTLSTENQVYGISNWRDIVAVDSGLNHLVGLRADGTVVAAGSNELGQCNVEQWSGIKSVIAGPNTTFGITNNGTVIATGDNQYHQCDTSSWQNVKQIISTEKHTAGLTYDGKVLMTPSPRKGFCEITQSWDDIVSMALSDYFMIGARRDGSVVTVITDPVDKKSVSYEDWKNIVAVAIGSGHTVGLKADGTVVARGENQSGQCNVEYWTQIVSIWADGDVTVGLRSDGVVFMTGRIAFHEVETPNANNFLPIRQATFEEVTHSPGAGGQYIPVEGTKYPTLLEQIVSIHDTETARQYNLTNILTVSLGLGHVVCLKKDGSVVAYGENKVCDVANWYNVGAICAKCSLTIGIKKDGTVVALGKGNNLNNPNVTMWPSTYCPPIQRNFQQEQILSTEQQASTLQTTFACPKCGNIVRYGDPDCPKCGQPFDWSRL